MDYEGLIGLYMKAQQLANRNGCKVYVVKTGRGRAPFEVVPEGAFKPGEELSIYKIAFPMAEVVPQ